MQKQSLGSLAQRPPGYVFNHILPTNRKGGGVAILSKKCLKIKTHVPYKAKSFENFQATVTCSGTTIRLAVIYRLHPQLKKNGVRNLDFFEEFGSFIDTLASQTGHLILLGDFNIHWDIKDELNIKLLVELLASSNLTQHVHESTHKLGHIIDLVITRSDDDLVNAIYSLIIILLTYQQHLPSLKCHRGLYLIGNFVI